MRPIASLLLAVCMLCASQVRADQVHLTTGTVIEGKATRHGDKVVVELESGEISLSADTVERIEQGESDVQRFDAQLAKLATGDLKGRLALANFCRDHGMLDRERQLLQQIIDVWPDHAEARARLGYVHTDAGWIKREQQLREQGMVKQQGQWVTQQQALEMQRLQAEADTAAHERDKAQAELESKRLEVASRQTELDRARATKLAEEAARSQAASQPQPAMPSYYSYTPYAPYYAPSIRTGYYPQALPRARVRNDSFPIAGVQDPWVYIRDPHGYPRP
ncbi:MAG TPA: hypothetical protein VF331_25355 [Polyangiales bacterium]